MQRKEADQEPMILGEVRESEGLRGMYALEMSSKIYRTFPAVERSVLEVVLARGERLVALCISTLPSRKRWVG